jgi:hypothetical protein
MEERQSLLMFISLWENFHLGDERIIEVGEQLTDYIAALCCCCSERQKWEELIIELWRAKVLFSVFAPAAAGSSSGAQQNKEQLPKGTRLSIQQTLK